MSLELKDIRAKIDAEAHRKLSALAISQDREISDLLRDAVDFFLTDEIRKAHAAKVFLRILGSEGIDRDRSGIKESGDVK